MRQAAGSRFARRGRLAVVFLVALTATHHLGLAHAGMSMADMGPHQHAVVSAAPCAAVLAAGFLLPVVGGVLRLPRRTRRRARSRRTPEAVLPARLFRPPRAGPVPRLRTEVLRR